MHTQIWASVLALSLLSTPALAASGKSATPASPALKAGVRSLPQPTGQALHKDDLVYEIGTGRRDSFGHDPRAKSPDAPNNAFLLVRDRGGGPHVLGILTPPGRPQPVDLRQVPASDAQILGRMVRKLMFADHQPSGASGAHANWELQVNVPGVVNKLHVHATPGYGRGEPVSDWNQFAKDNGYTLAKQARGYNVWKRETTTGKARWKNIVVGDATLGGHAELAGLSEKDATGTDRLLGQIWIEAAQGRVSSVEASRSDRQLVARGSGW